MKTFSFNPPINVAEEMEWLLAVTSFEATIFISNKTHKNISFSISTPNYWIPERGTELMTKLNETLEL